MGLFDDAVNALARFQHEQDQKDIRDCFEKKEFVCRNKILRETNNFLDTEFVTLKNHERQARADAMLRTKERLENERHTLRKEETSGRRSIEAAYSASLSLYKNASALFVQRNTEETELRSVKDAILTKEI